LAVLVTLYVFKKSFRLHCAAHLIGRHAGHRRKPFWTWVTLACFGVVEGRELEKEEFLRGRQPRKEPNVKKSFV